MAKVGFCEINSEFQQNLAEITKSLNGNNRIWKKFKIIKQINQLGDQLNHISTRLVMLTNITKIVNFNLIFLSFL